MLKWKDFSIGGYNFDNYSDVIELYIPTDVSMNPARTLHVRGRETLPLHLQHYFVPYGKVFIGLRATVRLTTNGSIGLFGTHFRWKRGTNPAWNGDNFDYWANIYHVLHSSAGHPADAIYICTVRHNSGTDNEPGEGAHWTDYWEKGIDPYVYEWAPDKKYVFNQFVSHDNPVLSSYRCKKEWTHTSGEDDYEPGVGDDWTEYWDIGDEMQADLSYPYYYYPTDTPPPIGNIGFLPTISLSEGSEYQFSKDIIGKFRGWHPWPNNHMGRALDALCTPGHMKQDGILWGVEVDDTEYHDEE